LYSALLEGFTAEVSHLLTREDIKKQSAEIVAANNKDEDMVPMLSLRKRKENSSSGNLIIYSYYDLYYAFFIKTVELCTIFF
jgi:hypothetical protein